MSPWVSIPLPQCSDGDKKCHLWTAVDLAFFVLMGVAGGLLGAFFNCINKRLAKYRMRHVHPKAKFVRYLLGVICTYTYTLHCSDSCVAAMLCYKLNFCFSNYQYI